VDEVQDAGPSVVDDADEGGVVAEMDAPGRDDGDLKELTEALEGADELPIEARLTLLRRAEEAIAGSLEGLDGL
jgi:hypothetical protein